MNCLQKLIKHYPREWWSKTGLSKNPNCTWEFFHLPENDRFLDIRDYSQNPTLKYRTILENPCSGWDWDALADNKWLKITQEEARYMPEVYNHIRLCRRIRHQNQGLNELAAMLRWKHIRDTHKPPFQIACVFDVIDTPPYVLMNTLRDLDYPHRQVAVVLQHPNMTFDVIYTQLWPEIVRRNPHLAMGYSRAISLNPNLTYEIVTAHPFMIWDFGRLSDNLFNFHPGKMALAAERIARAWRSYLFRQRLAHHRIRKRVLDSIVYFPGKGAKYLQAYQEYLNTSCCHDSNR
jgi:hypothetical protein